MGGIGSGKRKQLVLTDSSKKLIKAYRQRGYSWADIAKDLGFKSSTPIDDFRRENPDFDEECDAQFGILKMSLHDRYVEAALPKNGTPVAAMANRIAERYGIINPEKPSTAIQMNAMGGGIQVAFVEPSQLPPAQEQVTLDAAD